MEMELSREVFSTYFPTYTLRTSSLSYAQVLPSLDMFLPTHVPTYLPTCSPTHQPLIYNRMQAPGRINIIGEHVDYSGYPVLPCALTQRAHVICTMFHRQEENCGSYQIDGPFVGPRLICQNVHASEYPPVAVNLSERMEKLEKGLADCQSLSWSDYVVCGFAAAKSFVVSSSSSRSLLLSMENSDFLLLVASHIPAGAGLSSSSALVVTTALALVHQWGLSVSMSALAQACMYAERLVGTMGGG